MRNKLMALVFSVVNGRPHATFARLLNPQTYRPGERSLNRLERVIRSAQPQPEMHYRVVRKKDGQGAG